MPDFSSYDGTRIAYRTTGSGPLLVCLPGGPGRAAAYLEDLGGLARTNTLLLLDSRGTGASAIPDDETSYAAESLARDVEALREHLGLERLRLLGHSAGGRVAQLWAGGNPDRVEKLVLVTTYLSTEGRDGERERVMELRRDEPWFPAARDAADGLAYAGASERQRLERSLRPFWYGDWNARSAEHAASADGQMSPRASSRFATITPVEELRRALGAVSAPTLVVTGEFDALTPPPAGREVADAIPGARHVELARAGHFPWVDRAEEFRAAVSEFLDA